jgi:hydroxymethylbilane synthase
MLRIATRSSALARWQANEVAARLRANFPEESIELLAVETTGDRRHDIPISEIGGQGVFVKEVQAAVLDGRADMAVHSAKDLPSSLTDGLCFAAFPERADPRDALVGRRLEALAEGATVATGSARRRAQLAALRPDLHFESLRGNISTRLAKVPAGGAVVVAAAALDRLGLGSRAAQIFSTDELVPQVAQGALVVECRVEDQQTGAMLGMLDDAEVRLTVEAERAFLARLGTGCDLPIGAYATRQAGSMVIDGLIASLDGTEVIRDRHVVSFSAGAAGGAALATSLLDAGGARLIAASHQGAGS